MKICRSCRGFIGFLVVVLGLFVFSKASFAIQADILTDNNITVGENNTAITVKETDTTGTQFGWILTENNIAKFDNLTENTDNNININLEDRFVKNIHEQPDDVSKKRLDIVAFALQFVGNPYRMGGTSLTNGADCSGFTMSVYKNNGITIPRDSRSQAAAGEQIAISDIKPGDLLFYTKDGKRISHVAMYIGDHKVVHASTTKTGIKISNLSYRNPCKAVRFLDE